MRKTTYRELGRKSGKRLGLWLMGALLLGALTGCGSITTPEPVGVGREINQLKRSPCACLEIPQDYSDWENS